MRALASPKWGNQWGEFGWQPTMRVASCRAGLKPRLDDHPERQGMKHPAPNAIDSQAWVEIIQQRVRRLTELVREHQTGAHGGPDRIGREIDEARWQIVAAVQQMPSTPQGEQVKKAGKPVYTPEDLAEAWGCTTRHVRRLADEG